MDRSQIISQLTAHFENNFDRIRSLELTICPAGDGDAVRKYVAYGTAGFRGRAEAIAHLFYNVGLVAGLRCLSTRRANLGVMITASHNPVEDNGVKIVDANGSMLQSEWELIVEKFCNNAHDSIDQASNLFACMGDLLDRHVQIEDTMEVARNTGLVMLGHDSRPSCGALMELVKLGLDAWKPLISYKDYGLLTTPALHYLVGESTLRGCKIVELEDYYRKLAEGLASRKEFSAGRSRRLYDPSQLVVDNANGVGSVTMKYLSEHEGFRCCLPVSLINNLEAGPGEVGGGMLNFECGADYVKTKHLAPKNANQRGKRYASLDGDADRVVYFHLGEQQVEEEKLKLHLLDGDKILALIAYYLVDKLKEHELTDQLTLGVVQTAYANGASTDYLSKQLGLQVDCVDTGVKYLHKRALDYDFGVYFEANGHGTIWVSDKAKAKIEEHDAVELKQLLSVLNNYTGDAISDILIVESILNHYDWDILKWDKLYEDRPNSLTKVEIKDRELIQTTNAGRTCLRPLGLQLKIDGLVLQYGSDARCFVRASGTENVVRIYAECQSQDAANELAKTVGEVVIEMCNND